jgi:hypothetical protein
LAGLYDKPAVVFDNMAYTNAINNTYFDATNPQRVDPYGVTIINQNHMPILEQFYGNAVPIFPDLGGISGWQLSGQVLGAIGTGVVVGDGVNLGYGASAFN